MQLLAIGGFLKDMKTMSALLEQYDAQHDVWHQVVVPESSVSSRAFLCATSISN